MKTHQPYSTHGTLRLDKSFNPETITLLIRQLTEKCHLFKYLMVSICCFFQFYYYCKLLIFALYQTN